MYLKVNFNHYSQYINQRLYTEYHANLDSPLEQANEDIKKAIINKTISKDDLKININNYDKAVFAVNEIQSISSYVKNDQNGELAKNTLNSIYDVLSTYDVLETKSSFNSSEIQLNSEDIFTFKRIESFNESILKILKTNEKHLNVRNRRWNLFLSKMDEIIMKKDYRFQVNLS